MAMRVDSCTDMCIDVCLDVQIGICTDTCVQTCVGSDPLGMHKHEHWHARRHVKNTEWTRMRIECLGDLLGDPDGEPGMRLYLQQSSVGMPHVWVGTA